MNKDEGSQLSELMQVLPSKSKDQVQYLLRSLREEGKAHYVGYGRVATWYPGPAPGDEDGMMNAEGGTRNAEQISLYTDGNGEKAE